MKSLWLKCVFLLCLSSVLTAAWAGNTSNNNTSSNSPEDSRDGAPCTCKGMPEYSFMSLLAGLRIDDTPLGYTPPIGQKIAFTLSYVSTEADRPSAYTAFNLGPKWTLNWLTYIQDDPNNPGSHVKRFIAGGGAVHYSGYNAANGTFTREDHAAALLVRVSANPIVYELRYADGSKAVFAAPTDSTSYPRRVFLTKRVDAQGHAVTLQYDAAMRLVSITDDSGQVSTLQYDNANFPKRLTGIADPFGRSTSFAYDNQGRLSGITDAIGMTSTFAYEGNGTFINSMTTPYGTTTFKKTEGIGSRTQQSIQATGPLGYTERTEYRQNAPGISFSSNKVPAGISTFNAYLNYRNSFYWNKTAYAKACNQASDGTTSSCNYEKARIKHFLHNSRASSQSARVLESIKQPLDSRVWFSYPGDSPGRTGTLDKPNRIGRVLDDGSIQLTRLSYNNHGRVTKSVDPEGRVTHYTYASNGIDLLNVTRDTASGSVTLASFTWNNQHQPLSHTNAAGQTTHFTYNASGQLTSVTNALGETSHYQYDADGYLIAITNALGHIQRQLTYDAFGRVASVTDSEGYTVQYQYDALNRPTRITYPDGTSRQFVWNKLDLASVTDRAGHTTTYTYDAARRLTAKTDAMGHTTHYSYYPNGALKTLTDPNGNTTTWVRDIQGRVIAKTYADGTGPLYTYDSAGRLISKTDALGQVTKYHYTQDNRMAAVDYTNAINPTPSVNFSYGDYFPRLTSMTDGHGITRYRYYPVAGLGANQLKLINGPLSHDKLTFSYDALGRLASRTVAGSSNTLSYDPLTRVTSIQNALGSFAYSYLGDTGQVTHQEAAGIPFKVGYQYASNLKDRHLKAILNGTFKTTQPQWPWPLNLILPEPDPVTTRTPVVDYHFTTNVEGLITSRQVSGVPDPDDTQNGWSLHWSLWGWLLGTEGSIELGWDLPGSANTSYTDSFQYDTNHRLVSASGRSQSQYSYDAVGNLTAITRGNQTLSLTPSSLNQIASSSQAVYQYDANGNLLSDGVRTYAWDAANRLISITDISTGHKTAFSYDGLSRRITETEIATDGTQSTTHNLWCGQRLCAQFNESGNAIARYFSQGEIQNGTAYLYARDQVGSVVAMVNKAGEVKGRTSYGPYGKIIWHTGVQAGFAYAGLYHHDASGLYLANYRAYDPNTAHWLKRDPIKEAGGINLYAYVMGNPVSYRDLLGLWRNGYMGLARLSSNASLTNISLAARARMAIHRAEKCIERKYNNRFKHNVAWPWLQKKDPFRSVVGFLKSTGQDALTKTAEYGLKKQSLKGSVVAARLLPLARLYSVVSAVLVVGAASMDATTVVYTAYDLSNEKMF